MFVCLVAWLVGWLVVLRVSVCACVCVCVCVCVRWQHISVAQFNFDLVRPGTAAQVLADCEEEIDAEVAELIRRNGDELRQLRQTLKDTKREFSIHDDDRHDHDDHHHDHHRQQQQQASGSSSTKKKPSVSVGIHVGQVTEGGRVDGTGREGDRGNLGGRGRQAGKREGWSQSVGMAA